MGFNQMTTNRRVTIPESVAILLKISQEDNILFAEESGRVYIERVEA